MNKYEINTIKKKQDIIQAALSLFEKSGFQSVTIKQIAALANVSQVSIYNYFGSKEVLFSHCAEAVLQNTLEQAREILTLDIDFPEKMKQALELCTTDINTELSNHFTQNALNDPSLHQLLLKNINQSKQKLYREYIEHGKQQNAINKNLPTNLILDFLEALNYTGRSHPFAQLYDLLMYGLIGQENK